MRLGPASRVALVAEELSDRPDEGSLRVLERLACHLDVNHEVLALHARGRAPSGVSARRLPFTRRGVSTELGRELRRFAPHLVIYAPSASLTVNALWRARRMRSVTGSPLVVLGLQRRDHGPLGRIALGFLEPDAIVVTSGEVAAPFQRRGWTVVQARLGVDLERFRPVDGATRARLREELGWSDGRRVVLHVGHLRRRRGLDVLQQLATERDLRVVMVASESEAGEPQRIHELRSAGVEVHQGFQAHVEHFYQAADVYVFAVRHRTSAIDFPLSVLEALASGLHVATTPYGALPEHFQDSGALRFVGEGEGFRRAIDELSGSESDPRRLAVPFAWNRTLDAMMEELMRRLP